MYSEQQIEQEIRSVVTETIALLSRVVPQSFLVQSVLQMHREINGIDVPFYQCCAHRTLCDLVRRVLRTEEYSPSDDAERESPLLTGLESFSQLQPAYLVRRNDESTLVPLHLMTKAERVAEADQYDRRGFGCLIHARALREYEPDYPSAYA